MFVSPSVYYKFNHASWRRSEFVQCLAPYFFVLLRHGLIKLAAVRLTEKCYEEGPHYTNHHVVGKNWYIFYARLLLCLSEVFSFLHSLRWNTSFPPWTCNKRWQPWGVALYRGKLGAALVATGRHQAHSTWAKLGLIPKAKLA